MGPSLGPSPSLGLAPPALGLAPPPLGLASKALGLASPPLAPSLAPPLLVRRVHKGWYARTGIANAIPASSNPGHVRGPGRKPFDFLRERC